ncbi:MAG: hypothetical protein IPQ14_14565 [Candidatus Microthrix sp.]|uniref:RCC1-like domain-containing protein n=1 Tax=Candidatus Neomicrothrix sp. TaxID=2719034 RepID=UPI002A787EA7|nr:hypothetical protein [Candidatus Microthrix sp.]
MRRGPRHAPPRPGCSVVPGLSAGATGPPPTTGITQITSGAMHSCALLNSGSVRCWGDNGLR